MEGFPFVFRDAVRFSDVDCRNHVNNAVFSSYVEDARIAWYNATAEGEPPPMEHDVDVILARTEIDFRGEVRYGETVEVGVRIGEVRTKSLTMEYEIRARGRLAAEARSILVGFDYSRGASAAIPERWRRRLAAQAAATCR